MDAAHSLGKGANYGVARKWIKRNNNQRKGRNRGSENFDRSCPQGGSLWKPPPQGSSLQQEPVTTRIGGGQEG